MPDPEQAQRIYQLMVLTAWADGKVEASEALVVHEVVSSIAELKEVPKKGELSKGVKARIEAVGLDAALRELAAGLADTAHKELAFRSCAQVLEADGDVDQAEAEVLGTLQELFSLGPADVKRLLAGVR